MSMIPGRDHHSSFADAGTLLVAVTWGTTYVAMQSVGHEVSVGNFLFLRFGGAALLLTLLALPTLRQASRSELRLGVEFGVLLFLILALETLGVRHTSAANAGFLIALSVIFVPLVERATGRPIPRRVWGVTVVAIVATAMLVLEKGVSLRSGDMIIIAAAGVRAVQIVAFGYRSHARPTNPLRVTVIAMWVVAGGGLLLAQLTSRSSMSQLTAISPHSWALLAYLAGAATAFAFAVQLWAARVTSPTRVGLILSTEPVWAAASAVLFVQERFTVLQALGGTLLVAAVITGRAAMASAQRAREPVPEPI